MFQILIGGNHWIHQFPWSFWTFGFPFAILCAVRCYCKKTTAELEESISIAAAGWSHVVMCCPIQIIRLIMIGPCPSKSRIQCLMNVDDLPPGHFSFASISICLRFINSAIPIASSMSKRIFRVNLGWDLRHLRSLWQDIWVITLW